MTLGNSCSISMLHKQPSHPLTLYKKYLVTGFHHWVGKIPWRKEWLSTPVFLPGEFYWLRSLAGYRLHSMELWRVGHDWATKAECVHGASGKESAYQYRRHKRRGFDPKVRKVRKIPWRRTWQPTPVLLPGESHGQRSLGGYSPQCRKKSDTADVTQHARRECSQPVKRWSAWDELRFTVLVFLLVN